MREVEISPVPTEAETAAIVASVEALWPRPAPQSGPAPERSRAWWLSGRWWHRDRFAHPERPWS